MVPFDLELNGSLILNQSYVSTIFSYPFLLERNRDGATLWSCQWKSFFYDSRNTITIWYTSTRESLVIDLPSLSHQYLTGEGPGSALPLLCLFFCKGFWWILSLQSMEECHFIIDSTVAWPQRFISKSCFFSNVKPFVLLCYNLGTQFLSDTGSFMLRRIWDQPLISHQPKTDTLLYFNIESFLICRAFCTFFSLSSFPLALKKHTTPTTVT